MKFRLSEKLTVLITFILTSTIIQYKSVERKHLRTMLKQK